MGTLGLPLAKDQPALRVIEICQARLSPFPTLRGSEPTGGVLRPLRGVGHQSAGQRQGHVVVGGRPLQQGRGGTGPLVPSQVVTATGPWAQVELGRIFCSLLLNTVSLPLPAEYL